MKGDTSDLLRIDGLIKQFGGLTAVHKVSFVVPVNAIVAIIGPNGAGKTTLFHLISGFHRPDDGHVYFGGQEITNWRPEQIASVGVIRTFQLVRLFTQMTALENVLVGFHLKTRGGITSAIFGPRWLREQEVRIQDEAMELLNQVGLAHLGQTPANSLTYGQQRLLEIARALAARPKLLMLDEPAAGLNIFETKELATLIGRIRERDIAVLLVEHDMSLVMGIADHIHVLNFGESIASGTPTEIQASSAVIEAYLGGSTMTSKRGCATHV